MKLYLIKVGKSDACIRPLFANLVTYYKASYHKHRKLSIVITEDMIGQDDNYIATWTG